MMTKSTNNDAEPFDYSYSGERLDSIFLDNKPTGLFFKVMSENVQTDSAFRQFLAKMLHFEAFLDYSKLSRSAKNLLTDMFIIYSRPRQTEERSFNDLIVIPNSELPQLQEQIFKTKIKPSTQVPSRRLTQLFDELVVRGFITRVGKKTDNTTFEISPFLLTSSSGKRLHDLQMLHIDIRMKLKDKMSYNQLREQEMSQCENYVDKTTSGSLKVGVTEQITVEMHNGSIRNFDHEIKELGMSRPITCVITKNRQVSVKKTTSERYFRNIPITELQKIRVDRIPADQIDNLIREGDTFQLSELLKKARIGKKNISRMIANEFGNSTDDSIITLPDDNTRM